MKNNVFVQPRIKGGIGKYITPLFLFILSSFILPGCSVKNVAAFPFKIIMFFIQVLGIPFIVYLLMRMVMVRLSARSMKRKSRKAPEDAEDEKKEFTKPTTQISFKEFSETDDIFLTNRQSENLELAINTGLHTWNIFKKSVGFMLLGCVFIFIASKFLFGEFKFASPIWVLITTFIMYLLVRARYRAIKTTIVAIKGRIRDLMLVFSILPNPERMVGGILQIA